MTFARRVLVVCAVIAVGASASACKVLRRAADPSREPTTAAANAHDVPAAPGSCPFTTAQVGQAFGGRWTASGLSGGGCSYRQRARTVVISAVPLPRAATSRQAALDRIRKACDPGSAQPVGSGGFVCRQDALVEAATIAGNRLLVLCSTAGTDAAQASALRNALGTLAGHAR